MLSFARWLVVVWLCMISPQFAYSDNRADGMTIYRQTVDDFRASRFELLEETAEDYRANRSLTTNGAWRLAAFYDALRNMQNLTGAKGNEALDQGETAVRAWLKAYPQSKPAHIMLARIAIDRGWLLRGDRYAGDVTTGGWRGFQDHLEDAYLKLQKVRDLAADDPEWYATLLLAARAGGVPDEAFDALATKALRARLENQIWIEVVRASRRLPRGRLLSMRTV